MELDNIEITGDTVKSAVGKQIKKIFPDAIWYKDSITNPKYPNFYVNQVQLLASPDRRNRWFLQYLFSVEYRINKDPSSEANINTKLDDVGLKLLYGMDNLEEIKARTSNQRLEKTEGLLAFIFNVNLLVRKELIKEPFMNELKKQIYLEKRR